MHGMFSAAIILIVFALVAAVSGGSTVWLYRAASGPSGRSRPPRETPVVPEAPEATDNAASLKTGEGPAVSPVKDGQANDPEPAAETGDPDQPARLAPAPAVPAPMPPAPMGPRPAIPLPGVPAPTALPPGPSGKPAGDSAEPAGAEPAGDTESLGAEPVEGARIYVLDSSRRSPAVTRVYPGRHGR